MSRLVQAKPKKEYVDGNLVRKPADQEPIKGYLERVAKYVPAEIIATFTAINGVLVGLPDPVLKKSLLINVILFAILTPVYFGIIAKKTEPKRTQQVVSFFAFIIWAYSITGDNGVFGHSPHGYDFYYPQLASGLILLFSFISGFIAPREKS